MTATSVSITVETLRELGKLKGRVGTAILGAAIIDDIIGIIVLTFVIGMKDTSAGSPLQVIVSTICFFIFVLLIGFGAHFLFKKLENKKIEQRRIPILGLVFCLILSYVAEHFFGVADITGAFFAGIILCNIRSTSYIVRKIDVTSYMTVSYTHLDVYKRQVYCCVPDRCALRKGRYRKGIGSNCRSYQTCHCQYSSFYPCYSR